MFSYSVVIGAVVVSAASSIEIVLDDAGDHIRPGTAWTKAEGNCAQAGHAGGFHHNNGVHDAKAFAVWNFSIAQSGCYWVEEFHPDTSACDFSLSRRVPIHLHFCKGMHTAGFIDQSVKAGQWNKLVKLPFYTSHTAAIHISALGMDFEASGVWAADAFRLTWHAEDCHDQSVESDEAVAPSDQEQAKVEPAVPVEEPKPVKEEPSLPLLQAQVDDADTKVLGSTLEPVAQCPATAGKTFHHDALQKERRAQATFHFNPPHDGCYIVEEMHPELDQCKASANTKVHINYCKGLKALGTVDQSVNPGQWTYLAALPFYAGHPGNVTLSNDGTQPGTLAVFDQVRFTWSGKSCSKVTSHPRQVEVRIPVDFKTIAHRQDKFGSALKSKLANLAGISEKSLRVTGLRSGSIIASLLVMPSAVDDPASTGMDAVQAVEKLRAAVEQNADGLCALTDNAHNADSLAKPPCTEVQFTDLGVAMPTTRPEHHKRPQTPQEETETEVQAEEECKDSFSCGGMNLLLAGGAFLIISVPMAYFAYKRFYANKKQDNAPAASAEASSMEEGKANEVVEAAVIDKQKPAEDDNTSTLAPSSDKQSEPSLNGDIEDDKKSDLSSVKAVPALSIAATQSVPADGI
eukprot:gnl/MRDRNA2_/MRDRNA2_85137_c0_seq1.p1 gnl/MRDRNA2_/MRDRNA2_85137_c0~~gnl/MRDRNA2_/MRDRNA2_85137_c0_seq1.p1  ORF type:complete len:631 (+),score=154.99 gnl/MRDRNA2_/MRDRNA2_85137_c0_seq1:94-1986(+)